MAPRDLRSLTGKEGITLTPLRPAGSAEIEGERQDVISQGIFIPAGTKIKVIRVEGGRVLVHPLGKGDGKENE